MSASRSRSPRFPSRPYSDSLASLRSSKRDEIGRTLGEAGPASGGTDLLSVRCSLPRRCLSGPLSTAWPQAELEATQFFVLHLSFSILHRPRFIQMLLSRSSSIPIKKIGFHAVCRQDGGKARVFGRFCLWCLCWDMCHPMDMGLTMAQAELIAKGKAA